MFSSAPVIISAANCRGPRVPKKTGDSFFFFIYENGRWSAHSPPSGDDVAAVATVASLNFDRQQQQRHVAR